MTEIKNIFEQLADAIIISDKSSRIVFVNSACERLFGYKTGELAGKSLSLLMPSQFREKHETQAKEFIHTRKEATPMMGRKLITCMDANGNEFFSRISISCVDIDNTTYGVSIIQDYSSFKKELLSSDLLSKIDSLTNLYNRRYLDKILKPNSRILSTWHSIGVLYIDINDFKIINDTHGHNVGDLVLKKTAHRIKERIRYNDIAIRLGGDEFLILINIEIPELAQSILTRLSDFIHSEITKPVETENTSIHISASIGVGSYPEDVNDLEELINCADKSMYKSKKTGAPFISVVNWDEG